MAVDSEHSMRKVLGDVPISIKVQCDVTHIAAEEIGGWKKGEVIVFDKVVGEPMDVIIAGQLGARGEVVVINNRYGIRLSEVIR